MWIRIRRTDCMLLGEVLDRTDSFGEPHLEAGAPIGHIGEFDPPIHATHETCRYEEPQTCSPPWSLRGKKRIEDVGVIFWRQARPVVRHGDHDNPLTRVEIPESVHAEIIARTATVEVIDSGRVSLTPAKKMRRGFFLAPECDLDGGRVLTLYGVDGIEEKSREHLLEMPRVDHNRRTFVFDAPTIVDPRQVALVLEEFSNPDQDLGDANRENVLGVGRAKSRRPLTI